jgi:hypothetical protein
MNDPIKPKFSFLANNTNDADESGTARWELPMRHRGEWSQQTLTVEFPSFREAFAANEAMAHVFEAGREVGYDDAQRRVIRALA